MVSFRFRALYKGIVPKILRLGPGGAIMLLVNEYVFEYLCQRFPNQIQGASKVLVRPLEPVVSLKVTSQKFC